MSKRVLILSTTTGYQLRSFGDAAKRSGSSWSSQPTAVMRSTTRGAMAPSPSAFMKKTPRSRPWWPRRRAVPCTASWPSAIARWCWPPASRKRSDCRAIRRTRRGRARTSAWPAKRWRGRACGCPSSCCRPRAPTSSRLPCGCSTRSCSSRWRCREAGASSVPTPRRSWSPLFSASRRSCPGSTSARSGPARKGELLIESFIPGHEYAIEGVVTDGRFTRVRGVRQAGSARRAVLRRKHLRHAAAISAETERAILDAVQRAAPALGLRHGPVHAECRVNAGRRLRAGSGGAADRRAVLEGAPVRRRRRSSGRWSRCCCSMRWATMCRGSRGKPRLPR